MKRVLTISIIFLICIIPSILAVDTNIQIKTAPLHTVQVSILKQDSTERSFEVLERLENRSDGYGDTSVIYSGDTSKFDIYVYVKTGGTKFYADRFIDFKQGDSIYLEVGPEDYSFKKTPVKEVEIISEENDSDPELNGSFVEEEGVTQNNLIENKDPDYLSGFVTSSKEILNNSKTYYLLGSFLLIIIILYLSIKFAKRKKNSDKNEKEESKKGDIRKEDFKKEEKSEVNDEIKQAEEDFKKAKRKLLEIKNKDKIAELKKKLIEDEKELMKLRSGSE